MSRIFRGTEAIPAVLLIAAFVAGALASPFFLDATYLLDRTTLFVETGLMVLGMTFVIVCGQIDLSVASILALTACIVARVAEHAGFGAAVVAGLAVGALLGFANGLLVAYAKLPSILVTLATMALYRGAAQAMLGSRALPLPSSAIGINLLYLPYPVPLTLLLLLTLALALGLVLHRSVFGRWVYATGSNEAAAEFSAVPTARVKLLVFALSGLLAGLAGILIDSRLGVARFDHAKGFELEAITAAVLGGASIYGGRGSMVGAVLAFFLLFFVKTGLGLANVATEYQLSIVGGLLVAAVALNRLTRD